MIGITLWQLFANEVEYGCNKNGKQCGCNDASLFDPCFHCKRLRLGATIAKHCDFHAYTCMERCMQVYEDKNVCIMTWV